MCWFQRLYCCFKKTFLTENIVTDQLESSLNPIARLSIARYCDFLKTFMPINYCELGRGTRHCIDGFSLKWTEFDRSPMFLFRGLAVYESRNSVPTLLQCHALGFPSAVKRQGTPERKTDACNGQRVMSSLRDCRSWKTVNN